MSQNNFSIKMVLRVSVIIFLCSFLSLKGEGYDLNQRINHHAYPKLFNQIQNYTPSAALIDETANWDLLVLDAEVSANNPEYLGETGRIRSINPYAVIVFYFSAADIIPGNTAVINSGFIAGLEDGWYMKDINGDQYLLFELYSGFWTRLLNLSTGVNAYMPAYLDTTVISAGLGDGIFYDWINDTIAWVNHSGSPSAAMDIDNDGVADSDSKIDSLWVQGTQTLLANSGSTYPSGTLVTGNGGWVFADTYPNVMNGRMVEDFLGGDSPGIIGFDWHSVMRGHYTMHLVSINPKLSMIMANGEPTDYQFMRFALCSTLMFDGYFCYTNQGTYESTRWYDEYSVNIYTGKAVKSLSCKGYLGTPSSEAYDVDNNGIYLKNLLVNDNDTSAERVWRRDFENGIVLVNPTDSSKTVHLNGTFRKIDGIYDTSFNDGRTVTSVTLPSESGIVLLHSSPGSQPSICLNRTQLNFGAVINGMSTDTQTVLISNNGGGTLTWTAVDDSSWLSITPTAGESGGTLYVSVDSSQLGIGTHTGHITITDPRACNSPQTVGVTVKVYSGNASSQPFGDFATPIHGSTVSSSIAVTGWVLDDIGVESVKIYNGSDYVGDAIFVEGARSDIEQAYPDYPQNYRAGWGYMMLTNFLPNGGNGTFIIHAIAADVEGHQVTLGTKTIIVDNANAVKPFGAIDTPTQGGTANGSSFRNHGWVLTPMPNSIPTDGSTIHVYVDGMNLGHPNYNIYRSDIAALFPGYANKDGAGGYFDIDTTAYTNGVHTIYWTAQDNAGNIDGIGSRFFLIQNTGVSRPKSANNRMIRLDLPQISELPVDASNPIRVKQGYGKPIEPRVITPNDKGIARINIKELEKIEIQLADMESEVTGYIIVGENLRPLPIGSGIKNGKFHWVPVAGFLGEYRLVFVVKDKNGDLSKKEILVYIVPGFGLRR